MRSFINVALGCEIHQLAEAKKVHHLHQTQMNKDDFIHLSLDFQFLHCWKLLIILNENVKLQFTGIFCCFSFIMAVLYTFTGHKQKNAITILRYVT